MFFLQRLHERHHDRVGLVEMAAGKEGIPILAPATPDVVQAVGAIGQRAVKVNDHVHAPATKVWTSRCDRHDAEPYAVRRVAVGDEPSLLDRVPDGGVTDVVVQSKALGNIVNGHPMAGPALGNAYHVLAHGAGRPVGFFRLFGHGVGGTPPRPPGCPGGPASVAVSRRRPRRRDCPAPACGRSSCGYAAAAGCRRRTAASAAPCAP